MHKDASFILCELDEVQTNLDESLTNINNILGSRFIARLQTEADTLRVKLNTLSDTMEQWKEC